MSGSTRIRTDPYELTITQDAAVPPTKPASIGRVPTGSSISAHATPTRTEMNHHDRGAVRRSAYCGALGCMKASLARRDLRLDRG
ncbi:hypothetical protein GCM10010388_67220 [Streptomyces mauvecolor]